MSRYRSYGSSDFTPVVKNLIIINVLIWFAECILDPQFPTAFHGQIPISYYGALWPINTPLFEPYQVVTYMFLHASGWGSISHIFFNMLGLFFVGRMLETRWGPKRFLIFYLACGLGAGFAHLGILAFTGALSPAVGASGAIAGVFIAVAYLFPNTEFIIFPIPIPIKAKWLALIFIVYNIFGQAGQVGKDNVAYMAHLGGALTGFIIVYFWNKTNRKTFY